MRRRLRNFILSALAWRVDHPAAFVDRALSAGPTLFMIAATAPLMAGWWSLITLLCILLAIALVVLTVGALAPPGELDGREDWAGDECRRAVKPYLFLWIVLCCILGAVWPELAELDPAVGWGISAQISRGLLVWSNRLGIRYLSDQSAGD